MPTSTLGSDMIMGSLSTEALVSSNMSLKDAESIAEEEKNASLDTLTDITTNQEKLEKYAEQIRKLRKRTIVREGKKIRRNELCPCGSGKKYKNCCLDKGTYEKYMYINH